MKVKYISDLHLEFKNETIEDYFDIGKDTDVIVIAGDISVANYNANVLRKLSNAVSPTPVIYITGNHDFYHGDKNTVIKDLMNVAKEVKNFIFLNNTVHIIDDVVFIGSTGWQDDSSYTYKNFYMMNDFHLIKNHQNDVNAYGRKGKKFIYDSLKEWTGIKKTVVITHVIPCIEAINFGTYEVEHKKDYIKAYYNNWNDIIDEFSPDYWICGHCHDSIDVTVGKTRVLRNALGYKYTDRENINFDKTKSFVI